MLAAAVFACSPRLAAADELVAKVERYTSRVDGKEIPYPICATDGGEEPKALLVCVSPGGGASRGASKRSKQECLRVARMGREAGKSCVVIWPGGRGGGTRCMNYGEVDVFETIEDVCKKYSIDRDRIYVYGTSMGGAATWYLISHYPDFFAAAAPTCGYCDYRLWTMAGGRTFHMYDWEEPSWRARCAVFMVENLRHTPVWIQHGEYDRTIGGGVSVEHSRQMARGLKEKAFNYRYTEVPGGGHGGNLGKERFLWLLQHKKERSPDRVGLVTYDLRHNRCYWITIEQLIAYGGKPGRVDGALTGRDKLDVKTDNVRTLSLGPIAGGTSVRVTLDGGEMGAMDLSGKAMFRRNDRGAWRSGEFDLSGEKRHGVAGGIGDLFFENVILVPGTAGTREESHWLRSIATRANSWYRAQNGGAHRGGIAGRNNVTFRIIDDKRLTDEQRKNNNLLLFGTYRTNAVVSRFKGALPLEFRDKAIRLGDKVFAGDQAAVFAVFPHPENPERYLAVHGGVTPDATIYSAYIHMGLLPDFFAYSGKENLGWGFWGNRWPAPAK